MELDNDHPLAVAFVDLDIGYALLNNGDRLQITNMFDCEGDECAADDAIVVVAGSDTTGWWSVDVTELVPLGELN